MKYRIKEVLSHRGMTAAELARKIGTTPTTVSNIITGHSQPSVERLEQMADALGVSVPELMVIPDRREADVRCPNCQRPLKVIIEIDESR